MLKSIIPLSIATTCSRFSGFLRDYVLAQVFLTGPFLDLFFVLFRFPQYTRRFFAEGSFSQALMPSLGQHYEKQEKEIVQSLYAQAFWFLLLCLGSFSLSTFLFPKFWALAMAPGFDGMQQQALVSTLPWASLYALCLAFISLYANILQLHQSYWLNGVSPLILNVGLIVSALFLKIWGLKALIASMLIAGILQVGCQALAARPYVGSLIPAWPQWTPEFKKILKAFVELSPLGIIILFNTIIDQHFLSFTDPGEMSLYYLADRIIDLPVGILGYSIYSVFAGYYMRQCQDPERRQILTYRVLLFVLAFVVPATGAIALLAPQIMRLFVPAASQQLQAASLLRIFSLNILPIVLNKIFVIVLTAHGYRRQIVQTHLYGMAINTLLNITLFPYWQGAGVALASSMMLIGQLLIFERQTPLLRGQWQKLSWPQLLRPICGSALALFGLSYGIDKILAYELSPFANIEAIGSFAILVGALYLAFLWPMVQQAYKENR